MNNTPKINNFLLEVKQELNELEYTFDTPTPKGVGFLDHPDLTR